MSAKTSLKKAIKIVGKVELARTLGLRHQALNYWLTAGRLPRTEWSGETSYAKQIQEATAGEVTVEDLLGSVPGHR